LLRVAWVTLPVTAGPGAAASLASWSDGPRVAGAVLLWVAWAVGLLATLAPRPIMLTALRVIAPAFVIGAVLVAIDGEASTIATVGALAARRSRGAASRATRVAFLRRCSSARSRALGCS